MPQRFQLIVIGCSSNSEYLDRALNYTVKDNGTNIVYSIINVDLMSLSVKIDKHNKKTVFYKFSVGPIASGKLVEKTRGENPDIKFSMRTKYSIKV